VLDGAAGRVAAFDRTGRPRGGFTLPAGAGLGRPRGIAADEDGTAWVVGDAARVAQLDGDGRLLRAFGRPGLGPVEFDRPRAVGLDGRGRVVVLDWGNHRAMILSREGAQLGVFGGGRYAHPARFAAAPGPAAGPDAPAHDGADLLTTAEGPGVSAVTAGTAAAPPRMVEEEGAADSPATPASAEAATAGGAFVVQFAPAPAELPLNEMFGLTVRVLDGAGREPLSAEVELAVDAEMPAHRHGMTTRARVRREADGSFSVRGLQLHMPGEWRLTFDVTRGGVTERAEVVVILE
jgi:hypothetical protein